MPAEAGLHHVAHGRRSAQSERRGDEGRVDLLAVGGLAVALASNASTDREPATALRMASATATHIDSVTRELRLRVTRACATWTLSISSGLGGPSPIASLTLCRTTRRASTTFSSHVPAGAPHSDRSPAAASASATRASSAARGDSDVVRDTALTRVGGMGVVPTCATSSPSDDDRDPEDGERPPQPAATTTSRIARPPRTCMGPRYQRSS